MMKGAKMKKDATLQVYLTAELKQQLIDYANEEQFSLSDAVRMFIIAGLKEVKKAKR